MVTMEPTKNIGTTFNKIEEKNATSELKIIFTKEGVCFVFVYYTYS